MLLILWDSRDMREVFLQDHSEFTVTATWDAISHSQECDLIYVGF